MAKASDNNSKKSKQRWCVDLDWFKQNDRSFSVLAQDGLCPKCRHKLKIGKGEVSPAKILSAIKSCCSKAPGFISGKLPVAESVFRIFLANGNQSLDLEDLQNQLNERRTEAYTVSAETLLSILTHNEYYGLCEAKG